MAVLWRESAHSQALAPESLTSAPHNLATRRIRAANLKRLVREELGYIRLRLLVVSMVASLLPIRAAARVRYALLRLAGIKVGRGTMIFGWPKIFASPGYESMLSIGAGCWLNTGCTLDVHAPLVIEDSVYFGQEVMILTQTHEMGPEYRRAGALRCEPIRIGVGAWIGARATILPGVTIGSGAIVAAGATVVNNVPANTLVGGVPAKPIKNLGSTCDTHATNQSH
jgi:maltose O-acetyltransferase